MRQVDCEMIAARGSQEASVLDVGGDLFLGLLQLQRHRQAVEDGGARGNVALGLVVIEADDVVARCGRRSPIADNHFLDLDGRVLAASAGDDRRRHRFGVCSTIHPPPPKDPHPRIQPVGATRDRSSVIVSTS